MKLRWGDLYSGFKLSTEGEPEVVLKTADLKIVHYKTEDVERLVKQPISAMPEGILADLEPQQAADLLEFLASKK